MMTSAPRSASIWVHQGPASTRDKSSTLMPARAAGLEAEGESWFMADGREWPGENKKRSG
ncbi:hypothetical protein D3C81_1990840 [compost metagenome]